MTKPAFPSSADGAREQTLREFADRRLAVQGRSFAAVMAAHQRAAQWPWTAGNGGKLPQPSDALSVTYLDGQAAAMIGLALLIDGPRKGRAHIQ